ncbi:MAG: hypothetical protein KME31_29285 [Tolypothrix carrinoi HA7290-LM1]|jgi:hypothetical protein|nr:hypothetical protein [Tolypothrix carrinoi HA7290-LM1]
MKNQASNFVFDQERASNYDKSFDKLALMRDALDLLIRMVLSELSDADTLRVSRRQRSPFQLNAG